jgi:hypothetical protein
MLISLCATSISGGNMLEKPRFFNPSPLFQAVG